MSTLLLLPFLAGSCSMSPEARDQLFGGLGGAAVGAGIGALASGGNPRAIGAGALAGAVTGWGIVKLTQYHAEKQRSAQEEAQYYGYTGQGTMLNIREASVTPATVQPGQEVAFEMDYAVLAPQGTATIPVEESWQLEKDGETITKTTPQTHSRQPGGWHTRAGITVPGDAAAGTYIVKNRVSASGMAPQERIAYFNVQ